MSNEIFEKQIMLSLLRLEELWQRADKLSKFSPEVRQQTDNCSTQPQELLSESLKELTFSLEELQVVVEELHQQNKELVKSNKEIEAERHRYQELFESLLTPYLVTTKKEVILEANTSTVTSEFTSSDVFSNETLFRAMFENTAVGMALLDSQGYVIKSNRTLQDVLGCTAQSLPTILRELIGLDQAGVELGMFQELIAGQHQSYQREKRFFNEAGVMRWGRFTISLVQEIGKEPTFATCLLTDITEYKESSGEKSEVLAKEEKFSKFKSRFFYVTAHELRNPLNTIFACADLIENNTGQETEEKKRNYLQYIKVNIRRINQLLDDLLLMEKLETGATGVNPSLIDLKEFCRRLIAELQQEEGQEHKISLIKDYQLSGIWDEKLLRRILKNLFLNAIKYSAKGSEIKLNINSQNKQVIFEIKDSGIGIPKQDQELLFQAFYRGSNVGKVPGNGLGLLIAKQCAIAQGGEIAVESKEGVGTTFRVTLPLHYRPGKSKKVNLNLAQHN